jgi:hypothetical protein
MDSVGIFRNQLFKKSEVFIRQQAESLTRHKIHYIGRKLYGIHLMMLLIRLLTRIIHSQKESAKYGMC